jgi:hypothetical protein
MTPQSTFMVLAPIAEGREDELRGLLASMNLRPGVADPENPLVPFGEFDRLHFARFVIVEAPGTDDISAYGIGPSRWPPSLAFLGDCDGPADTFLADLALRAGRGLRRIFSLCHGFSPDSDLLLWMRRHDQPATATYVNWIGRTVLQIREEQALHRALLDHLQSDAAIATGHEDPVALRDRLARFVAAERRAGRLTLSAEASTPLEWRVRNAVSLVTVPIVLLVVAPFLLVASPLLVFRLRALEKQDPDIDYRAHPDRVAQLSSLEDQSITNQFNIFGQVKPGRLRRWTLSVLLKLLDYSARHVYNRGHLTRVQSIHSARWVFLDDRRRLLFASNYDGSVESYMDDFINKVAWGINLVFSNGMSYPSTDYLIKRGARDEQRYKRTLRRHQLPSDVWYNAYPGLGVVDLAKNTRIREGIERPTMTDAEAREWLSLL